jgi:hypothetical protein
MADVPHRTLRSIALDKGTKLGNVAGRSSAFTDSNYCGACGGPCRGHAEDKTLDGSASSGLVAPPAPFRTEGGR